MVTCGVCGVSCLGFVVLAAFALCFKFVCWWLGSCCLLFVFAVGLLLCGLLF